MALTKCAECGHELSTSAAACPHCGAPVRSATPPPVPPPPGPATVPARKPNRTGLWIGIAAAVLLVGLVAVILVFVATNKLTDNRAVAESVHLRADIQGITSQLRLYESINGFYPTTEQGLRALVARPTTEPVPTRWHQLFKEVPHDPWHTEYVYRYPGRKKPSGFDLFSAGPDRIPDTADDVWSD